MACDLGRAGPDKGCLLKRGNSLRKNSNPGHCCRVRPTGVSSPRRMAPASPSPTHKIRQCDALLVPPQQGPRPEGPVSTPPQTSPSLGAGSAVSRREQQATPKEKGGCLSCSHSGASHPPSQPGQSRRVRRARTRTRAGHTASPWAEVVTGARQTPVGMCHAERTRTITATDARAISLSADPGFPIDPNWQLTLTAAGHGHRGDENLLALPQ